LSNLVSLQESSVVSTRRDKFVRVIEALWLLVSFDVLASATNFGAIQRWTRSCAKRATATESVSIAQEIAAAVNEACSYYPKTVACLQRSTAITRMLRRRGISAETVVGVQLLPFASHAWVEVGGVVVNDKARVKEAYREIHRI
jgi:hypothetical protein